MGNRWGNSGNSVRLFFFLILNFYIYFILLYSTVLVVPHIDMNPPWVHIFGAPKSLQMVTAAMKFKKCLLLGRKFMTNLDSILKSRDYFANEGPSSQGYDFSSGHVWM